MTKIDQSGGGAAPPPIPAGRLRAAWRAAHAPVAGVPRWAAIAAHTVPFVVLPSSIWRLPATFFHGGGLGVKVYVVCLSIVAELAAFTAVGLVASWGERFPRWIPWLRGRTVPPLVAVIPATVAAAFLTVAWTVAFVAIFRGVTLGGAPARSDFPTQQGVWPATIFYICYLPLLLWGPLLAVVTYAYHRRRRHQQPFPGRHPSREDSVSGFAVSTRSHTLRENSLIGGRRDVGGVVRGACSWPGPLSACAAGNGRVRSRALLVTAGCEAWEEAEVRRDCGRGGERT